LVLPMYLSDESNGSPEIQIDWAHDQGDHLVQWYDKDSSLVHSVTGYVFDALGRGGAAIVVATKDHRNEVEERLESEGLDIARLQRSGRYIAHDAAETLNRFMVRGSPDPEKFLAVVGSVVSRASNSWNGVRAFGEMVGVLWEQGQFAAAIELERLWHRLIHVYSLPLFCAYPKSALQSEAELESFGQVCDAHGVVIL
jgi:hypothetical protein